jgi:hypothetical protein
MDTTIARLIDDAAQAAGLNDYQLSAAIGLLPGNRVISPKQVARMRRGEQKHYDQQLLRRLTEVFPKLDSDELWLAALEAANLRPSGLTVEHLRRFRELTAVGAEPPDPGGMMSASAGFARERRHPMRRRHLRLVEHVEQVAA